MTSRTRIGMQVIGVAAVLTTAAGLADTPKSHRHETPRPTRLDLASLLGAPLPSLRVINSPLGGVDCDAEPGIIIHDDGTVESGYAGNPEEKDEVRFVDKFTPTAYPSSFSAVCVSLPTLDPDNTTADLDIVVYDDDGTGDSPGTELGSLQVTADDIPAPTDTPIWFSYDISPLGLSIQEGSVYIGVRLSSVDEPLIFIAADQSDGNPPGFAGGYWWTDGSGEWVPTHDPDLGFENYRSLMVRAVQVPIEGMPAFAAATLDVDTASGPAADGNGVFEPGESVDVVPGWLNTGTVAGSLNGSADAFSGPGGDLYDVLNNAASYGSVEPNTVATCLDGGECFEMGVDAPTERPVTHWDATFDETLDDVAGTTKTWTLHIGDSFVDVSSASPFYPAIEGLLHSGVTGGCTAGADGRDTALSLQAGEAAYCPGDVNSRAQMPVFMLRALEGIDYTPPACDDGGELFDDVSFSNPFCPWIEELADRGIVAGCGDGNYCPRAPVTRAQMAIFLLKTLAGDAYEPPVCDGIFTDVTCPSLFADWIEDLAARGITSGCTAIEYCPAVAVTRGQMAVFVTTTFGLKLYGP